MDRRASYAGKPVAFTPSMISGLRADWDGDVNYGGAGGTWSDRSGIGNHLTCTGTAAGAGKNGKGTVLFNGTTDVARIASLSLGSPTGITVAIVAKLVSKTANAALWSLDATNHLLFAPNADGGVLYISAVTTNTAPTADVSGGFRRFIVTDDGTSAMALYYQGSLVGTVATPTATIATSKAFAIGSVTTTVLPSNIDVARCLAWNRVLTASELFLVDTYFSRTYAV